MGFSWQEYWRGLPSPSPGGLPVPWIQPVSLESPALAGGFFTTTATWEAHAPFPKFPSGGLLLFPIQDKSKERLDQPETGASMFLLFYLPSPGQTAPAGAARRWWHVPAGKVSAGPLTEQGGVTPESPDTECSLPAPFRGHSAVWSASRTMLSFGPCTLLSLDNRLPVGRELLL